MDNKLSVPKLDLSFSLDSVRSTAKLPGEALKDNHAANNIVGSSSSRNSQTARSQLQPPYAVDVVETPTSAVLNKKPQYDPQQWIGCFTPYNENRTARKLLEREFTDLNIGRNVVESKLPEEEEGTKPLKEAVVARPFSAMATGDSPKRVSFGARLLINSDSDALRDFTGFFWPEDSTLAIYEFRGLSKATSRAPPRVLPFVTRARYNHAGGIRHGQPVMLCDISEGRDIVLSVSDNAAALNNAIRQRSVFVIRVTQVDLAQKRSILLKDVRISDHDKMLAKMHGPQTEDEAESRKLLFDIRSAVKNTLRNRGILTLLNMRHELNISVKLPGQDTEKNYRKFFLTREETTALLDRFNINLNGTLLDRLFSLLDIEKNNSVDFGEFCRAITGGISETRYFLVRRAWLKMDPCKTGYLSVSTIRKFYSARRHPDVVSGERTEQQIINAFTSVLQPKSRFSLKGDDGEAVVGFCEFEAYYDGLSLAVDSDEDFLSILKDSWGILSN